MVLPLGKIQQLLKELNNWYLEGDMIMKEFSFESFGESIKFVNFVAEIAEENQHHPSIIINYKEVKLMLTTHSESGLTEKDFMMAKLIDGIKNDG